MTDSPATPATTLTETKAPITKPQQSAPKSFLAVLAILLSLSAGAFSAWVFWMQQQLSSQTQTEAYVSSLRTEIGKLSAGYQNISMQLDGLATRTQLKEQQQLVVQLQSEQQALAARFIQLLGEQRQGWRLAEVEYLLRLASLRLQAVQDTQSALSLVDAAYDIMHNIDDPAAFASQQELAKLLAELRATQAPKRNDTFLQIHALRAQITGLTVDYNFHQNPTTQKPPPTHHWLDALKARLSAYVRIQLDAGEQSITPTLNNAQQAQARLALDLALEQAQWAALNAEPKIYELALAQAQKILTEIFVSQNALRTAMQQNLIELSKKRIAITPPDMQPALSAVHAYLTEQTRKEAIFNAPQQGVL